MISVTETEFEGLLLFNLTLFKDERGFFYESWRAEEYKKHGIKDLFVQDNISYSRQNVLRGLHYSEGQGQLVTVLRGRVFDVVVDLRPFSMTFKKYFSIELAEDIPIQLYMPAGCAHGFYVLSSEAMISYKCTQYYSNKNDKGVFWKDPELLIAWPCVSPVVSEKDKKLPLLADAF